MAFPQCVRSYLVLRLYYSILPDDAVFAEKQQMAVVGHPFTFVICATAKVLTYKWMYSIRLYVQHEKEMRKCNLDSCFSKAPDRVRKQLYLHTSLHPFVETLNTCRLQYAVMKCTYYLNVPKGN